jgi:hypothetical protein
MLMPPPLLATEDEDLYCGMLTVFARSIRPGDLITWMLVKDLADHRTEIARYRRFKASLITAPRRREIRSEISYWRTTHSVDHARVRTEQATQQKAVLAKSNKTPEEKEKLIAEIDAILATEITEAEAKG